MTTKKDLLDCACAHLGLAARYIRDAALLNEKPEVCAMEYELRAEYGHEPGMSLPLYDGQNANS